MDFDDQMVYAYSILTGWDQVLLHFQDLNPYICVDEAQDTSKIQHSIIKLLVKRSGNLFMVGDEDQSIYGFRAAYPQALLEFEKVHDNAKVLLMEGNFRSNANIHAQIIDDTTGKTLAYANSVEMKLENGGNVEAARKVGEQIAKRALEQGIEKVVFDRGGYVYHGRVQALADAAREAGLKL